MKLLRLHDFAGPVNGRWVALVAGALLVTAFAPFGWYWIAPLPLACLLLLWERATPRQAAWIGFAFGVGLFAAGTWWLYISLNILGGLWPPLALLMMLVFIIALASFAALAGYVVVRYSRANSVLRWLLVFPAGWALAEWLRGWVLTGFPWMSIGYSQTESVLGSIAPLVGVYGVTWVTVLLAGGLVACVAGNTWQRLTGLGIIVCVVVTTTGLHKSIWTQDTGKNFHVRLVQGAIPQEKKWLPEQLGPTLSLYRELSVSDNPLDLIVWPEAAIPALPYEVEEFLHSLHDEMVMRDTQLFAGILTYDFENDQFLNTLLALGKEEGRYYKRHLVAFGEYFPVPDFVRQIMRLVNLPSESISPGSEMQEPLYAKGVPVAPTICYEIAFGAEQLSFFPQAQLLVNVSNDAWFGNTIAPHQHLQINQFRARETGRYMLRTTNTGITAVINPAGHIEQRIPQFEPGFLDATVRPYAGQTPYMRFGNWLPITGMVLLMVGGSWFSRRKTD
ncbi:MAG: apolipoprotein N-acyltransferase [Gammaproteobacteria bacterium]|nr:apolipoprotein N-acyltransferase [Gammaproteobacteria bacterium]MCP4089166.1 apolipoprotein N-acyltransferase [Gammaproteobacteria bacterium]MCP4276810.1 apolipoprotein N-acyltransferase [Gammaproteobacteria bacterium]MCP4830653.1 apolipoprotein N-acyltransferase [Gammaproteobacteria bacterium]